MSVIIRLQNLPWSANAADVRGFFRGLSIPDGGVHIVGGENGDAFIAFSTDEDARQAMMLTGSKLKEIQVTLLLSSRAEMQKVIEQARQTTVSFIQLSAPAIQPQPPIIPASLSGFLAQQMVQQNPQSPLISETPIDTKKVDVKKSGKTDRDRRRSRSKSRDRRRRSRSRDRSSRRRDRSKSKDRRRSRRSKSRERNRSRERSRHREASREKDRKIFTPAVKQVIPPPPVQPNIPQIPQMNNDFIWDVPPINFPGNLPFLNIPMMTQMPPIYNPAEMNVAPPLFTSNTAQFNKYDLPPPVQKEPSKAIKISNLDYSTSYSEIRRYFGSLIAKDGIKMINNHLGRRTGCAVILFQQITAKLLALQRTGQRIKNSIVLIEDIEEIEYFKAVDNFKPTSFNHHRQHSNDDDECVIVDEFTTLVIEDIPSFTKEQDIIKMFSDITLKDVIIGKKYNELQAYAKFYRSEDAKLALNGKATHFVGYKNVSVSVCSDLAYENAKREFEQITIETKIEQPKYPTDPRQRNRLTANSRNDENNWNENNFTVNSRNDDSNDRFAANSRFDGNKFAANSRNDENNWNESNFTPNPNSNLRNDDWNENNFTANSTDWNNKTENNLPDIRNMNFNQNRFNNQNYNNQNNHFNSRMNNRLNFDQRNRFNDNNQYNNRRSDNSDDRRSFNNNINGNRQEFNQRFQDNDNRSFNGNYDKQNDHRDDFNDEDDRVEIKNEVENHQNKVDETDGNSTENSGSVIFIPDDPIDDEKLGDETKLIIDENIEHSMEEMHTDEPIQDEGEETVDISDCIILQNLDSKTTEKDVIEFFADVDAIPANVHMLLDTDKQPSGDCFCEFNNVNAAERAVMKNNKNLGPNSVKVEFIPRFKVEEIISSFGKNDENNSPRPNQDEHQYQNDFPNFRRDNNNGHNNYNNGQNNYNNNFRGGRGRGGGGGRGRGRGEGRFNNNNSNNNNNRFNSGNNNGNVLCLSNIPYRADTSDILNFFCGFDLTENDVNRRYNYNGRPTADARVAFLSADDAREALETCSGKQIGNREISLSFN